MEFNEVKEIGEKISEYVTWNEYNLWTIAEAGIYNVILKDEKIFSFVQKQKHKAMRFFISNLTKRRTAEKRLSGVGEHDILVIVSGVSQVNTMIPIFKGRYGYKVIRYDSPSDDSTRRKLEEIGQDYVNLESYMNDDVARNIRLGDAWMKDAWRKVLLDKHIIKAELGEKYDIVMQVLEYMFKTRRRFLEIITYIELYKEIFGQEKVKLVFVSDDVNPAGRLACMIARENRVKSLDIQHGQVQGNPVGDITADKMIVNGEEDKRYLIKMGAKQEKIVVTGQPRYDIIPEKKKLSRENLCEKYGLDPMKKIIVFNYQRPVPEDSIIIPAKELFLEKMKDIKGSEEIQFVVTMRKDVPMLDDFKRDDITLFRGTEDIHEMAVIAEMLVTAYSTVAIEFVLMGKPVIALNIGSTPDEYVDYTKIGVGFKIVSKEDFVPAVEKILYDKEFTKKFNENQGQFVKDFSYKLDGKAKERCLKVIDHLVEK